MRTLYLKSKISMGTDTKNEPITPRAGETLLVDVQLTDIDKNLAPAQQVEELRNFVKESILDAIKLQPELIFTEGALTSLALATDIPEEMEINGRTITQIFEAALAEVRIGIIDAISAIKNVPIIRMPLPEDGTVRLKDID